MSTEPIILSYLRAMNAHQASDIYLTVGFPPTIRKDNELVKLGEQALSADDIEGIINAILTTAQRRDFKTHNELNTALDMGEVGRFRINVMRQRQSPALVIRRIITRIPSFQELMLPVILEKLSVEKRGLILVAGMTGSGKSTSLAAMIDYRNMNGSGHIITVEDPIEYFHDHKGCVVSQREVGVDTESFSVAMKNALRQRPDVLLVGEIRDRDVMEQALTISETGHLCLASIHANNSYQAIERIVNLFPDDARQQVRLNLSMNLKAIISQRLIASEQGGLVPAVEVMINQALVRDLILQGEIGKIQEIMEQNTTLGMCTFDQSLLQLYAEGRLSEDVVITNSDRPSDMKIKVQQYKLIKRERGGSALASIDTSRLSFSE